MKKVFITLGIIVVIGLIAWGVWSLVISKNAGSNAAPGHGGSLPSVSVMTQSGTSVSIQNVTSPQDQSVSQAFLNGISNASQTAVGGTVVVSSYALQIWGNTNGGGEALLQYGSSTGWSFISGGGGEWSVLGLVEVGVPVNIAEQLIVGLTNSTSTVVGAPANIPTGATLTVGTSKGSVTMNNFYQSGIYIAEDGGGVVIQQNSTYVVVYNVADSSFSLVVTSPEFATVRPIVEAALLSSLDISQSDACKLAVYENVPAGFSNQYAGQSFPLSFCGGQ